MNSPVSTLPPELSVTDAVFKEISGQIRSLQLPPGAKLSEAEVARQFGISRQPVRDAFHQLSKLGFLVIRPQRATEVSLISPSTILAARFLRTAAEVEMVRRAATRMTTDSIQLLRNLIENQRKAVADADSKAFKRLDDRFHYSICDICGLPDVWTRIAENKAHTDRLRLMSIRDSSQEALQDHEAIFLALQSADAALAMDHMRTHLDRIKVVLDDLQRTQHHWFSEEDPS